MRRWFTCKGVEPLIVTHICICKIDWRRLPFKPVAEKDIVMPLHPFILIWDVTGVLPRLYVHICSERGAQRYDELIMNIFVVLRRMTVVHVVLLTILTMLSVGILPSVLNDQPDARFTFSLVYLYMSIVFIIEYVVIFCIVCLLILKLYKEVSFLTVT